MSDAARRVADRIAASSPALLTMLDEAILRLEKRWWHSLFPFLDRARRRKHAEEVARLERRLDEWAAQLEDDEALLEEGAER